jgi:hypothetical protein
VESGERQLTALARWGWCAAVLTVNGIGLSLTEGKGVPGTAQRAVVDVRALHNPCSTGWVVADTGYNPTRSECSEASAVQKGEGAGLRQWACSATL